MSFCSFLCFLLLSSFFSFFLLFPLFVFFFSYFRLFFAFSLFFASFCSLSGFPFFLFFSRHRHIALRSSCITNLGPTFRCRRSSTPAWFEGWWWPRRRERWASVLVVALSQGYKICIILASTSTRGVNILRKSDTLYEVTKAVRSNWHGLQTIRSAPTVNKSRLGLHNQVCTFFFLLFFSLFLSFSFLCLSFQWNYA